MGEEDKSRLLWLGDVARLVRQIRDEVDPGVERDALWLPELMRGLKRQLQAAPHLAGGMPKCEELASTEWLSEGGLYDVWARSEPALAEVQVALAPQE